MYLGIDYGKKRIGLALGQVMPRGAGMIDGKMKMEDKISSISLICKENEVELIVIGMPAKPSGDESEMSSEIKEFGDLLQSRLNIPVAYEEEQFTSTEAESILRKMGEKIEKENGKIDEMAAVLILEQYINNR